MKATVAELVTASKGKLIAGAAETIVEGVSTDTRQLERQNAFIALIGKHYDAHRFLGDATSAGASCLVVSSLIENAPTGVATVLVDDTQRALGDIAHWWRARFAVPIVGITGSAGKTTTKEMLATICSTKKRLVKNAGNLNNLVGLPLSLLAMEEGDEVGIFEMGTNSPGEIKRLTTIAQPTLSLITNIGLAHLGGFGSVAKLREEKLALFTGTAAYGTIVINNDDEALRAFGAVSAHRKISFGLLNPATVTAEDIHQEEGEISCTLVIEECRAHCLLPVYGLHNISNALGAAAAAYHMGFNIQEIATALKSYRPPSQRLAVLTLNNGARLIDDTYNANPEAMKSALDTLEQLARNGNSLALLGDMHELGEATSLLHREIGAYAAETGVKRLFLHGKYASQYASGARQAGMNKDFINIFTSLQEAQTIYEHLRSGDVLLIKGSRSAQMEKIVEAIKQIDERVRER